MNNFALKVQGYVLHVQMYIYYTCPNEAAALINTSGLCVLVTQCHCKPHFVTHYRETRAETAKSLLKCLLFNKRNFPHKLRRSGLQLLGEHILTNKQMNS